jgi:hypothetical protein
LGHSKVSLYFYFFLLSLASEEAEEAALATERPESLPLPEEDATEEARLLPLLLLLLGLPLAADRLAALAPLAPSE